MSLLKREPRPPGVNKGGRRRMAAGEKRSVLLNFKVTPAEAEECYARARRLRISLASYIRGHIFGFPEF